MHRWIGNAAEDGRAGTVFARLKVPSSDGQGNIVDHGVHAIVVPLRDASGQCMPGVEIRDCGYKVCPHASSFASLSLIAWLCAVGVTVNPTV